MSLKIVVLAKQVPDTRNVGKDAMTAEGTVNRAALPAIFNPQFTPSFFCCFAYLRDGSLLQTVSAVACSVGTAAL